MKKEMPKVNMVLRRTDHHMETGFFLLKKSEKVPFPGAYSCVVDMPAKAMPAKCDSQIVGWIDFQVNGASATTTHILPRGGSEARFGISADQLSIMRLVFLKESIDALASKMKIKYVGTSPDPSEYTADQVKHRLHLQVGVLYPVKQFTDALSNAISKGVAALGG